MKPCRPPCAPMTSGPGRSIRWKRVAEDDLRAEALELLGRHGLDRAVGAHRHEGRRLDHPWAVASRPARAAPSCADYAERRVHARAPASMQHGVAVAEEAVARAHRVRVGREHALAAGEGAHQHQQCRLRQVEVGEQRVNDLELKARRMKRRVSPRRPRAYPLRAAGARGRLERPHHRRADRDDAPARGARARDRLAGLPRRLLTRSACMTCAFDFVDPHRLERARADMQRDAGALHAARVAAPAISAASKCRLAVGAATAPGRRARKCSDSARDRPAPAARWM